MNIAQRSRGHLNLLFVPNRRLTTGGGRQCPLSYRYRPTLLANDSTDHQTKTLFVVGGLYGNLEALRAVEHRVGKEERDDPLVVFNGDFNFFNYDPGEWDEINRTIMSRYLATAGNVEVESVALHSDGSCGCAYPGYVGEDVVDRSNLIVQRLRRTALSQSSGCSDVVPWLRSLPMFLGVRVGAARVSVIHGDPESLSGWSFAAEAMEPPDEELRRSLGCARDPEFRPTSSSSVDAFFDAAQVDVFACTHTCMPFAQLFRGTGGATQTNRAIINNGSAGMPNFRVPSDSKRLNFGLMTRISSDLQPPSDSVFGATVTVVTETERVRVDAVPVRYDHGAWIRRFKGNWPPDSEARVSYYGRIKRGVDYVPMQAAREGFDIPP